MVRTAVLSWILRILAAVIMLQTLFFKFSASTESVYIFSTLGMEPWGRIGTGIIELVAAVLLLLRPTVVIGAMLAMGIMAGAVLSHVFFLGIVVQQDSGLLFSYALITFCSAVIIIWIHRNELQRFLPIRS